MDPRMITTLADRLAAHVPLSKSRRETLGLLVAGMISARTTNLSHVACERGTTEVKTESTYRRLQRFFQHVDLPEDWSGPLVAGLSGSAGPRCLILDRTNWKIGKQDVNLLVLAVATRRNRLALMWTVLDRAGNSGATERIALIDRYIAAFGKDSIGMLLADREFIGGDWIKYLIDNDIPFTIRMRGGHHAVKPDGKHRSLRALLTAPRSGRRLTARLPGLDAPLHFTAKTPKGRETIIVASNRLNTRALELYRKRWAIESLFGDAKSRGLNFEDTRLTCPRKLHLLTAILAVAMAWASCMATEPDGPKAPRRKCHGYLDKSWFRTGFDWLRNLLRADPDRVLRPWDSLNAKLSQKGVV